jgi:GDP-mannose 6-dehydrogenase
MPPGTCEEKLIPVLESMSGGRMGEDFDVCMNPEFLREGSGIEDFNAPTKTVIGAGSPEAAAPLLQLYRDIPGRLNIVPLRVAEFIKYVENSWHALKISFANEVGAVSEQLGMDSHQVMELFLQDTKLNVSPAYLRPGFAFGGSCLPKDVRGLTRLADLQAVDVPVIEHIMPSNQAHLARALRLVTSSEGRRVGLFGLSFKRGTDDLRESPYVTLAEQLVGKGYELRIYDSNVSLQRVIGQNRRYIEQHLPHIGRLIVESPEEAAADADICVLGMNDASVIEAVARSSAGTVVDLVKIDDAANRFDARRYRGLCW